MITPKMLLEKYSKSSDVKQDLGSTKLKMKLRNESMTFDD